ncbi:MAG TPA: hypothetical protein VIL46_15105 [Gemmataceae bacterium]
MTNDTSAPIVLEPTRPAPASALRVVLFGLPDAGKSSLLGALAQAAELHDRDLQGRLVELAGGLLELQRLVYHDRTRETREEIVPYPVVFEPLPKDPAHPPERLHAVLYDCDGRVANELLTRRKALAPGATKGSLAQAILDADALVLVIDASAPPDQVEADFREFRRFLRFLRRYRSEDRAIGGLPVYLALSKCDKLAQPGDALEAWQERVARRQAQVRERFEEFMTGKAEDSAPGTGVPFGSLDLHVAATAVRRPELADVPPPPRPVPWGVAGLFRGALEAAAAHRGRARRSRKQLFWVATAALGLITLMLGLAAWRVLTVEPAEELALLNKVLNYQAREGTTPSQRLAEGALLRRLAELTELRQDPEFERLPEGLRRYVEQRLAELEAYRDFRDRLYGLRPPAEVQSLKELEHLEQLLRQMEVPDEYRGEWGQTLAVQLREKWLKDVELLRDAVHELDEWYRDLIARGNRLLFSTDIGAEWNAKVNDLLRAELDPPFRETDPIPGSRALPVPRGGALTYGPAFAFDLTDAARRDWEAVRFKLTQLQNLTAALGMLDNVGERRAVLAVPPPAAGDDLLAQARQRLERLREYYPRHREWSLAAVPDTVRDEVRRRLLASLRNLVAQGHELIRGKLRDIQPTGRPAHSDWLQVADWLRTEPVRPWREFLEVVEELLEPGSIGAVARLRNFLTAPSFEMELREIRVKVPDQIAGRRLRPTGDFNVYHRPAEAGSGVVTLVFRPANNGLPDQQGFYHFALQGNTPRWTYRPDDRFWATLALTDGTRSDWQFTWSNGRTLTYQFDRLLRPPYAHRQTASNPAEGELVKGVELAVTPSTGLPEVPALLPEVR